MPTAPPSPAREPKQIALIRGINVGKPKRVAMADLRRLLEGFGWSDGVTSRNWATWLKLQALAAEADLSCG